jgi:hypothetical protein
MNVARFAAVPLAVALSMLSGCSDPPSPPPQGAVSLKVGVTPGKICSHTNGLISMPFNQGAGVYDSLNCDLSAGCKPDKYVVVDRDRGSSVQCTVAPNGDKFSVSVSLSVDGTATGTESLSFGLSGVFGATGGTPADVTQQNSVSKGGGQDDMCTVSIAAPRGLIKQGRIWGNVHCDDFRNPSDISETGCQLDAVFLFENCGG